MRLQMSLLCSAVMFLQYAPPVPAAVLQDPVTVNRQPARNGDAQSVLHRLEGVWRVEARFNSMYWNELNETIGSPIDRTQPGTPRQPGGPNAPEAGPGDSNVLRGIAESKMILNGQILGEKTYLMTDGDGTSIGEPGSDRLANAAKKAMQSLAFFSFEPAKDEYTAVFMSDRDGSIHYKSGRYDVTGNRIVFEGPDRLSPAMITPNERIPGRDANPDRGIDNNPPSRIQDPNDPNQDPDNRDRTSPNRNVPNQPPTGMDNGRPGQDPRDITTRDRTSARWHEDVRIVVEILSNDQHRVTMYKGSMGDDPMTTPRTDPTAPGRTTTPPARPNTDDKNIDDKNKDLDDKKKDLQAPGRTFDASEPLAANIVYQATFTRTTRESAQQFRDQLRKADELNFGDDDEKESDTDR